MRGDNANEESGEDTKNVINKKQFAAMYERFVKALAPEMDEEDVEEALDDDWNHDARGQEFMTYPLFHMSVFQIADMWCEGVSAAEYVALLELLLDSVSRPNESGRREYKTLSGWWHGRQ